MKPAFLEILFLGLSFLLPHPSYGSHVQVGSLEVGSFHTAPIRAPRVPCGSCMGALPPTHYPPAEGFDLTRSCGLRSHASLSNTQSPSFKSLICPGTAQVVSKTESPLAFSHCLGYPGFCLQNTNPKERRDREVAPLAAGSADGPCPVIVARVPVQAVEGRWNEPSQSVRVVPPEVVPVSRLNQIWSST